MNSLHFLQTECQQANLDLNRSQLEILCSYATELEKWSRKMNLVARGNLKSLLTEHFLDSLCLYPFVELSCESLLDVGTGAGFPGLVLGAVCPQLHVTLVEPRAKRVSFLRHIVRALKLKNITIIPKRLEVGMEIGSFSGITSRAFAELAVFLPLVEGYLNKNGSVFCMKGPKGEQEFLKFQQKNPKTLLHLKQKVKTIYPIGEHGRCLMIFKLVDL